MAQKPQTRIAMPPVVARVQWWMVVAVAVHTAIMVAVITLEQTGPWTWWPAPGSLPTLVFAFAYPAGGGAMIGVWIWKLHRIRRIVSANRGELCTRCLYPMRDAGLVGTCPECGEPFDRQAAVAAWRKARML